MLVATVTTRCRSLAYGWLPAGAAGLLVPCASGGLRAVERELQCAVHHLGKLPGRELLLVGGRRVVLPPGGVSAVVDVLRRRGSIQVHFDNGTPRGQHRAGREDLAAAAFCDLDRALHERAGGPASLACQLEDARCAWAELRESDELVRLKWMARDLAKEEA